MVAFLLSCQKPSRKPIPDLSSGAYRLRDLALDADVHHDPYRGSPLDWRRAPTRAFHGSVPLALGHGTSHRPPSLLYARVAVADPLALLPAPGARDRLGSHHLGATWSGTAVPGRPG